MAAKATAKPRRRQKQPHLPGMEPPSIKELNEAAAEYVMHRDARMASLKLECEAGAVLLELMHKHKLKVYEHDGDVVTVKEIEKIKVKTAKGEENGDGAAAMEEDDA